MADQRTENIREKLQEKIIALRRTSNDEYGVFNGDPRAEQFLHTGTEPLKNVAHILLFTDGFLLPKEEPAAPDDFATMTKLFLEGGLTRIRDYVRKVENDDPKCWEYPRYKKSDDIAAIALSFS